jgi:hypothetical protein
MPKPSAKQASTRTISSTDARAVYLHPADKYSRLTRRPLQEQKVL